MSARKAVYVAGPLTRGNYAHNVRAAIDAGVALLALGYLPFVPHAYGHVWDVVAPMGYEEWMAFDLGWVARCDALLRLPGESPGADREVGEAERLGLPVFRDFATLGTRL